MFQHVVNVDGGLVILSARWKHFGELLGREVARFCERVGLCVRISRKLARVTPGEDYGLLCD